MPQTKTQTSNTATFGENGQSQAQQTFGEIKDKHEQWEQIQEFIPQNELPPDGLVPLWPGSDIYTTPAEPVDPSDCEKWPGSWACSNPLPGDPTDIAPSIESGITYSDCSICVTFTPSLGIITFPPYTICRIREGCEEPEEEEEEEGIPEDNSNFHPPDLTPSEWEIKDEERLIFFNYTGASNESWDTEFDNSNEPTDRVYNSYPTYYPIESNYSFVQYYENNGFTPIYPPFYGYRYQFRDGISYVLRVPAKWQLKTYIKTLYDENHQEAIPYFVLPDGTERSIYHTDTRPINAKYSIVVENDSFKQSFLKRFWTYRVERVDDGIYDIRYIPLFRTVRLILKPSEQPLPSTAPVLPRPTPIPSPQPMPRCCDLSPILKELALIKKAIGPFPTEVEVRNLSIGPVSIPVWKKKINNLSEATNDFYRVLRPDEFGKRFSIGSVGIGEKCSIPKRWVVPGAEGQVDVDNYQDLILYLFRFLDRVAGFWPVHIKVKDANPAKKGDQSVTITANSIADLLKELGQYLIDTEGDTDTILNAVIRNLYTSGSAQQMSYQALMAIEALHEAIGTDVEYRDKKMMMAFSPDGGMSLSRIQRILDANTEKSLEKILPKILDAKQAPVRVMQMPAKSKSLIEYLIEIDKNARNSAASVTRPIGTGPDGRSNLNKLIQGSYLAERLGAYIISKAVNQISSIGNLEDFLKDAEKAYETVSPDDTQARPMPIEETAGRPFGTAKGAKATKRKTRRKR